MGRGTFPSTADLKISARDGKAGYLGDVNTPNVGNMRFVSGANQEVYSLGSNFPSVDMNAGIYAFFYSKDIYKIIIVLHEFLKSNFSRKVVF